MAATYTPPKLNPKDLASVRERRTVLKDILNSNLLAKEARVEFERQYTETGHILEQATPESSRLTS